MEISPSVLRVISSEKEHGVEDDLNKMINNEHESKVENIANSRLESQQNASKMMTLRASAV